MLSSIHPLGERARKTSWGVTVTAYLVGSTLGGALLGGVLGSVGWVLHQALGMPATLVLVLVAGVSVLGAALDLGLGGLAPPTIRRQVDEDWLNRYRGWVYGLGFGFQLGLGVVTVVTTATVYVTFALALVAGLAGSARAGLVIGAVFGLARAAPILLVARVRAPDHLRRWHRRLQALAPVSHWVTVAGQWTLAAAAVWLLVGTG